MQPINPADRPKINAFIVGSMKTIAENAQRYVFLPSVVILALASTLQKLVCPQRSVRR